MGLGRLGVVGVRAGRDRRADICLDLLVLLDGRLDHVDPDRALRDRLRRLEDLRETGDGLRRRRRTDVWTTIKRYSPNSWSHVAVDTAHISSGDTTRLAVPPYAGLLPVNAAAARPPRAGRRRSAARKPEVGERLRDGDDEFGVARRALAVRQDEVVLEADARVPAEQGARGHAGGLPPPEGADAPVREARRRRARGTAAGRRARRSGAACSGRARRARRLRRTGRRRASASPRAGRPPRAYRE